MRGRAITADFPPTLIRNQQVTRSSLVAGSNRLITYSDSSLQFISTVNRLGGSVLHVNRNRWPSRVSNQGPRLKSIVGHAGNSRTGVGRASVCPRLRVATEKSEPSVDK